MTCTSSSGPYRGDRGSAIKPVRADSRMPKGPMSLRKELIRDGFADLKGVVRTFAQNTRMHVIDSHFDNAAVGADIQYLAAKLVREVGDALEVLMLVTESLASCESAGMEVL